MGFFSMPHIPRPNDVIPFFGGGYPTPPPTVPQQPPRQVEIKPVNKPVNNTVYPSQTLPPASTGGGSQLSTDQKYMLGIGGALILLLILKK